MTADLYPTPSRVALLRNIDNGLVTEDWIRADGTPGAVWLSRTRKVTTQVRLMKAAGWCRTDPADHGGLVRGIVLTAAGREILEQETAR